MSTNASTFTANAFEVGVAVADFDIPDENLEYLKYEVDNITFGLPTGYINGLLPSNNATDANNDIDIAVGKCRDDSDTVDIVLETAITKQLDAAFAEGTNAGGLNTGTKANNTWYDLYIIAKADGTTDVMFSTYANRETLPTDFVYKRYIGAIRTDASGNIRQGKWNIQSGGSLRFIYNTPIQDYIGGVPTTASLVTLTSPSSKASLVTHLLRTEATGVNQGPAYTLLTNPDQADVAPSSSIFTNASDNFDLTDVSVVSVDVLTNDSSQIRYRGTKAVANSQILTRGYIDERTV